MFHRREPEVLVAGAGPVGLFAALSLVRRQIGVRIIDEEWREAGHSYALALHPGSLELFAELGLASKVLERARCLDKIGLYDGPERRAEIAVSRLNTEFPFVAVIAQSDLESLLVDELAKCGVEVEWRHRLSRISLASDSVQAEIDTLTTLEVGYDVAHGETVIERTKKAAPRWVLAADGHESLARTQLGIRFERLRKPDDFVVFEFDAHDCPTQEVCVVLDDRSTNVLWPLSNRRYRWSFQLIDAFAGEDSRIKDRQLSQTPDETSPYLTREHLELMIAQRAPWFRGRIGAIHWCTAVRFEYRLASAFGKGRIWLAGDAAHLTSPVGAQSMNVGLREAATLCRTYAAIMQNDASKLALSAYDDEQRAEWRRLFATGTEQLPLDESATPWVRTRADRLSACIPASGDHLARLLEQLGVAHRASTVPSTAAASRI